MAKFTKTVTEQTPIIRTGLYQSIGKVGRGISLHETTGYECKRFLNG